MLKLDPDLECVVLETKHLRIIFGTLDPPGMPGLRNPTFTNYVWDFWTHLGCLVPETQHLRIIFWILDPPGMFGVGNPTFTNSFWDFGPRPWMFGCQNAPRGVQDLQISKNQRFS